jgi:hypothetical protein
VAFDAPLRAAVSDERTLCDGLTARAACPLRATDAVREAAVVRAATVRNAAPGFAPPVRRDEVAVFRAAVESLDRFEALLRLGWTRLINRTNALTSWSFRMACHPGTPRFLAIWARSLRLRDFSVSTVMDRLSPERHNRPRACRRRIELTVVPDA